MKKYNTPAIELNMFDFADSILALSGGTFNTKDKLSSGGKDLFTASGSTQTNVVEFYWK